MANQERDGKSTDSLADNSGLGLSHLVFQKKPAAMCVVHVDLSE